MTMIKSWSHDRKEHSTKHALSCLDPSRTIQSQKDEADINVIVRNFGVTGKLPQGVRIPEYGDFEGIDDYREAVEVIKAAEASFMAMPSELRARLDNDPHQFVAWCADPANLEEMRKLGLAPVPVVPSGSEGS